MFATRAVYDNDHLGHHSRSGVFRDQHSVAVRIRFTDHFRYTFRIVLLDIPCAEYMGNADGYEKQANDQKNQGKKKINNDYEKSLNGLFSLTWKL